MEYVRMGTLGQLIKERENANIPFTDEETATIMNSIFKAVNYIHSLSIIHRDIKPENILIHDKNELHKLKIADFGLGAKLEFRSPTAISKCGTYLFMAPEILWNYTYTKAVDVWSCAIIMYMLKKKTHPFY
jgi:calcium/calmodulin-dependent protein kinase I